MTVQPWHGREVVWRIDGELFTARYNPAELVMMRIARERGCATFELEALHLFKALIDATIVDSSPVGAVA